MLRPLNFLCFFSLLTGASAVQAQQTVYISDVLYVPMRTGASIEYRIIDAAMRSGTRLTRVEQSEDGLWSKVVTESGTEGWIRNQYLSEDMTAQRKLDRALARLARIEKENGELKAQNSVLTQNNSALSNKASSESQTRAELASELEKIQQLSAGAIELDRRHQALLQKYEMTQTERDSLLAEMIIDLDKYWRK